MPSHNYSLNLLSLIKLYQVQLVVDPEISERGLGYLQVHVGGLGKHNKLGGGGVGGCHRHWIHLRAKIHVSEFFALKTNVWILLGLQDRQTNCNDSHLRDKGRCCTCSCLYFENVLYLRKTSRHQGCKMCA